MGRRLDMGALARIPDIWDRTGFAAAADTGMQLLSLLPHTCDTAAAAHSSPERAAVGPHLGRVVGRPGGVAPHARPAHRQHGVGGSPAAPHAGAGGARDHVGGQEARQGPELGGVACLA